MIKSVAKKWKYQYHDIRGIWSEYPDWDESPKMIYNSLLKLDVNMATEKDVKKILGNDNWTKLDCDVCMVDKNMLVMLPIPLREYEYVSVCEKCLEKALRMVKKDGLE